MLDRGLDLAELAAPPSPMVRTASAWRAGTVRRPSSSIAAVEHELPFVCVSAGTRNHFALDLGLDREDPRQVRACV